MNIVLGKHLIGSHPIGSLPIGAQGRYPKPFNAVVQPGEYGDVHQAHTFAIKETSVIVEYSGLYVNQNHNFDIIPFNTVVQPGEYGDIHQIHTFAIKETYHMILFPRVFSQTVRGGTFYITITNMNTSFKPKYAIGAYPIGMYPIGGGIENNVLEGQRHRISFHTEEDKPDV